MIGEEEYVAIQARYYQYQDVPLSRVMDPHLQGLVIREISIYKMEEHTLLDAQLVKLFYSQ